MELVGLGALIGMALSAVIGGLAYTAQTRWPLWHARRKVNKDWRRINAKAQNTYFLD